MKWTQIEADWKKHRAKILNQWAKLTADDLERVAGARGALVACITERYGLDRADAERQVEDWLVEV